MNGKHTRVIALAGNPNVGKSTLFNALTGMHQHTGNWPGKTVEHAAGEYHYQGDTYTLVDLPGTYSLLCHSREEEIARDFLCFGAPDAAVVVCDATCLERNLILVLQTIEVIPNVVVCINLMDEAAKKGITVDTNELEKRLGVPVVATSARSRKGLHALSEQIQRICACPVQHVPDIPYRAVMEQALAELTPVVQEHAQGKFRSRWLALQILCGREELVQSALAQLPDASAQAIRTAGERESAALAAQEILPDRVEEMAAACAVLAAEDISGYAVRQDRERAQRFDRKLDRILTSKHTGIPIMILLFLGIFWLTMTGANLPSELLSRGLFWLQDRLTDLFRYLGAPEWLHGLLVEGMYRVLAWVVAVMLPPMAIFFPLFTLLEDFGYLPRIAFNLDRGFQKAHACGKQALTMCMGLGCNAVGVTGCRIIDSARERMIAIVTNSLTPCNGRFPTLIAVLSMFFAASAGALESLVSALLLMGIMILSLSLTFLTSRVLSATLLKGQPSSFTLELPPYRRPQVGKVIVRSLLDRTLFVLGRAVMVAAPAGAVIWLMANITVADATLLAHCARFLDPFARLLGLDGVILIAFILGFPANEIVVPIIMMAYAAGSTLVDFESLSALKMLLVDHGWTWSTAVSVLLFSIAHWPCSTTCLTIRKETGSFKWTFLCAAVPTAIGMTLCFLFTQAVRLFS